MQTLARSNEQTKLVKREWFVIDGDTRTITLLRGYLRMVLNVVDDSALDWDNNCLGRGDKRRAQLNEMWDYYADMCNAQGEEHYDDGTLQVKIMQRTDTFKQVRQVRDDNKLWNGSKFV